HADGDHLSNSDPVTGQAGWYDVRVKIYPVEKGEPKVTFPQFKNMPAPPGAPKRKSWIAFFAGAFTGDKK
ncbi:MAG: hypothetical protein OEL79_08005, partial [Chromatiales bacterium]|nr:hypothetical protein [Chromatiales bacterium]